jgi:hypothetical protein
LVDRLDGQQDTAITIQGPIPAVRGTRATFSAPDPVLVDVSALLAERVAAVGRHERVPGRIRGAAPRWQDPRARRRAPAPRSRASPRQLLTFVLTLPYAIPVERAPEIVIRPITPVPRVPATCAV